MTPTYKIVWSTESTSGELPCTYIGLEAALTAASEWLEGMIGSNEEPYATARDYRTEVIRTNPIPKPGLSPYYQRECPMSITDKLNEIIHHLQAAVEDAEKVDSGKAGSPGTRLRKVATRAGKDLSELRKAVLEARKG